jgi:hypothetical protein
MPGRATWLVVVALAAIGIAAAVDAFRGGDATPLPQSPAHERRSEPQATYAEEGFGGILYYTNEGCELRAVRLPTLERVEAPRWDECRFELNPDGTRANGATSGWDPYSDPDAGRLFQTVGRTIQVASSRLPEGSSFHGSAPAWRSDGTLTYARRGAVRAWPSGGILLSGRDLWRAAARHPNAPAARRLARLRVRQLAWLDASRGVVLLHVGVGEGPDYDIAALFEGRRLLTTVASRSSTGRVWTSPGGSFFAVLGDGMRIFDRDGDPRPSPPLSAPRALAFSPDERWVAVATRASVVVFQTFGAELRLRRLPIVARDLAWRSSPGTAALRAAQRAEARLFLTRLGATGRLLVTLPGCHLRTLRIPELRWEGASRNDTPCDFTLDEYGEILPEGAAAQPSGDLVAVCQGDAGVIDVFDGNGLWARLDEACAPTWTPDGRLTFIRRGEVWQGVRHPRPLLSGADIRRMLGRDALIGEVAWADDLRFWAVVRRGLRSRLVYMTRTRPLTSPPVTARQFDRLRVASSGGMVAAQTERGAIVTDPGGRRTLTFPAAQAVSWEPGELVVAIARPREILFAATISRDVVSIPLSVEDLEWVVP